MVWPLIIGAGMSMLSDGQQNNANYKAQTAQNKAIREANTKNVQNLGFQVGLLNVQRGQRIRQLSQRKADLGQAELLEVGAVANNAAASGTVGASVDAVESDAQLQFERARAALSQEDEIESLNYNTALHDLLVGGRDSIISHVKPSGMSDMAMIGRAAISAVGQYYGDKMQLGLGTSGQSNTFQASHGPSTRGGARAPATSFRG